MFTHRSARPWRAGSTLIFLIGLVASALPTAAGAQPFASEGGLQLIPRKAAVKPAQASIPPDHSHRRLHLKFAEGTAVRLRGVRFVTLADDDLTGLREVLGNYPGVRPERLFERPELELAFEKMAIELESLRQQADKNLYYRLILPRKTDAVKLIDDLNGLPIVEIAYAEPLPAPPPSSHGTTPDFSAQQTYADAPPDGIDADFAAAVPGGTGANVRIIDIEYSWNTNHEDLSKARAAGAMVANKTATDPFSSNDHGTAVLGEMIADNNAFGVTGLAHGASVGMTNANNSEDGYDLADSIDIAHAALSDGDLILLEQQTSGPNGCNNGVSGCVAVEWVQAYYDAIVSATSDGIIVVEAAGNGNENLDDTATYGSPFPSGRADSGAIIVGSANYPGCTTPTHGRRNSSTFGARVNLHAYGECVTTTGYGGLQGGSDPNVWYTGSFNGTSSASPIVTSAAAILSSVAQQQGDANGLSSTEVRALLAVGATPQDTSASANTGNVGPMPDLGDALSAYVPVANAGGPYVTAEGADITLDGSGSSDPQGTALTYEWDLDDNGSFETTGVSPTFSKVGQDGAFTVRLRVTDAGGATDVDTVTVVVNNVAPTVGLASNAPRAEGAPVTVNGTISDAGWLESPNATIDWGDGSSVEPIAGTLENTRPDATLSFSVSHPFGDNATYAAEVCGSDDDTTTCQTINIGVTNLAPTVSVDPSQDTVIDEGEIVQTVANFNDPGWLDTYTGAVDWGTLFASSPAIISATDQRPAPDGGTATSSRQYGDNGVFTVTTTVNDDDGASGSDAFDVTVNNIAPTATIDKTAATVINGVATFLAHAGETMAFNGSSQDPGSDDLYLSWDWDDGSPAPDSITPYLLNAPLLDGAPSPEVADRDITELTAHAFGQACLYEVAFGAEDDDAGSSSDAVSVLIVANATARRSAGYWQQQYRPNGQFFDAASLECYLEIAGFLSQVFNEQRDASTIPKAYDVLSASSAASAKLDRQLLAALLNFANGTVAYDETLDTDGDGLADTTFADMMTTAETVRLDPTATDADLEAQKDILERFNRKDG